MWSRIRQLKYRRALFLLLLSPIWLAGAVHAAGKAEDGQAVADKIASFTIKAIYNLDTDHLLTSLENFLEERPEIKALTVTETIDQERLLTYFRRGGKGVYDQPIPEHLLALDHFKAESVFESEIIGIIDIYYVGATAIALTEKEKSWIKDNPRIRVHNETDWPPFDFAENGEPRGLSIDTMDLLAGKIGIEVEYITGPTWNEFLGMMKAGTLDVMLNIVKTPERQKYLLFTPPYADNPNTILSRRESVYQNLEQLFGKTVSVPKGFFYEEILTRDFPKIKVLAVKNTLDSMKAVSFGRADAAFGELAVFNHLLAEHLMSDLVVSGEVKMGDPEFALLNIATRKDLPILASILTKAVKAVTDEERKVIRERWFGKATIQEDFVPPSRTAPNPSATILQYVGIVFGGIIAVVFVAWVVRGRPKYLSIRETLFLVSFVFACLIVSIGVFVTLLLEGVNEQAEIEARENDSLSLALELKQSSDELTRFARTFVLTQEPRFEEYYNALIAIRDGKRPHPKNYTLAYWDQIAAKKAALDQDGGTYSIAQKMVDLGFSEDEQTKIAEAKRESDDLVRLETVAMNAVKGLFADDDGKFIVAAAPDLAMAQDLLYGADYHDAKSRIMKPLDTFFAMLRWRIANELADVRLKNQAVIWAITGLTAATIAFSIYVFFLLNRRILSPLGVLETGALAVGDGDYSYRVDVKSNDEIGALSETFNHMAHGIEERSSEIAQRNSELATAYSTISDSINYATNIQHSVLPRQDVFDTLFADHFVIWEPRDRVGGDIYWCRPWGLGYLIICADCTGHGVPGAFMTLIASAALERSQESAIPGRVGQLISRMHQLVQINLKQNQETGRSDDGLELGACFLDIEQSRMTFSGARFSLFACDTSGVVETKGDKSGIGYRGIPPNQAFTDHSVDLVPGVQYYMTSDGLTDQVGGERRRMFGKKRFMSLLEEIHHLPMAEQKVRFEQALSDYQGNERRRDDVSVIGFRVG